jgi:hypothetical protein
MSMLVSTTNMTTFIPKSTKFQFKAEIPQPIDICLFVIQVRCFELSQLSLKFERHLDSEIVDFEVSLSTPTLCVTPPNPGPSYDNPTPVRKEFGSAWK